MRFLASILSLLFVLGFAAQAEIPKFAKVTDNVWRGGRPTALADIQKLQRNGFKLIINLETTMDAVQREQGWAQQVGIEEFSSPMDWLTAPTDEQINTIIEMLSDSNRGPVFVHCTHGEDRTGLVVGLYRVLIQKWGAKQAHDEMLKMGFHTKFEELDQYFWNRSQQSE